MSNVTFGVQYNGISMGSVMGPLEFAQRAESWGYTSFFVPDLETLPSLDPLTLLTAVGQQTQNMRLGTGVLALPFRNPYQLAKTATSIATLTEGRLILGLGTGILPRDFHVEQLDMKRRGKMFDEGLDLLSRLLTGETVSHHGPTYTLDHVTLAPPVTHRVPLWVGGTWNEGFAPAALRRAAKYGDGFHPHDTPVEGYAEAKARIEDMARADGRDPSGIEWACNMFLCMDESKEAALEEANAALKQRLGPDAWDAKPENCYALGTAADCIATIEAYAAIGVTHFVMNVLAEPGHMPAIFERFASEVIPHFS